MLKGKRKGRGEHAKYISVHVSPRISIFLRDFNTKNSLKIGSITTADYSVKLMKQPGSQQLKVTLQPLSAGSHLMFKTCQEAAGWSLASSAVQKAVLTHFFIPQSVVVFVRGPIS